MRTRLRWLHRVFAAALACAAALAQAQAFPTKPVKLVIPYPAGGLTDVIGRAAATEVAKIWGQPLLVENRPGGNQIIASEFVVRSPADGYTILMCDVSALAIVPVLYASKLTYDPYKDFAAVLNLVKTPDVLVAHPSFPANTVQELIKLAKEKPNEITYGTFGLGSLTHVDTEAFSAQTGISLRHIPYKGIAEVLPAVASGQIQIAFSGMPPLLPLLKQGRIKVLGVASAQRSPILPDVPTFAEAGVAGFVSDAWFGLVAPAATPRPIIDKIAADLGRVIAEPSFNEKYISGVGMELMNQPPDKFMEVIRNDQRVYAARVKALNLKLE